MGVLRQSIVDVRNEMYYFLKYFWDVFTINYMYNNQYNIKLLDTLECNTNEIYRIHKISNILCTKLVCL